MGVVEERTGPSAIWFAVAGVLFLTGVVTGALVARSGASDKVRGLVSTQIGPANSGHIYFDDHLQQGTYALVYTAPGLNRRGDVPQVSLSVRRVGGGSVAARVNPSDAYLDRSYSATSSYSTTTSYRSRGRAEVAVFVTPASGEYHLQGKVRPASATGASPTPPTLDEGELRLYPYRLRDESNKVFNGIFGVLSRVGLGILIAALGFVAALVMVIVVAVARGRANRPPPGPPGPFGPWSGGPGPWAGPPGGAWSGGPGPPGAWSPPPGGPPGGAWPAPPPPGR